MERYNQLSRLFKRSPFSVNRESTANAALSKWEKYELRKCAMENRNEILQLSCSNGWYVVSVKLIEEFGLDPNVQDENGNTALHRAYMSGNEKLVSKLISLHKCDPFLPNKKGRTPLHWPIEARNSVMLESLINSYDGRGSLTSLTMDDIMTEAWKHWNDEVIKCLINEGRCGLSILSGTTTILHECVGKHFETLKFILDNCRCGSNILDKNGNTILHKCAFEGDWKAFHYLVTNRKYNFRQEINKKNNKGATPLHVICASLVKPSYIPGKEMYEILCILIQDSNVPLNIKFSDSDISVLSAVCKAILKGNHDPSILHHLIINRGYNPSNDSDLVLYALCHAICHHGSEHIALLSYLVKEKLGPYLLRYGKEVCVMCCPLDGRGSFLDYMCHFIINNNPKHRTNLGEFFDLSWYFLTTVKHECSLRKCPDVLLNCVKEVYSRETISLPLLHQLVTTFGIFNNQDSLIDADTFKKMIQDVSKYKERIFQNPLHSARLIICCLKSYSSTIYSLFYDLINDSKLNLMSKVDVFGNTLIHLACLFYDGDSTLIEYLLSTNKNLLCKNNYQQTHLTLLDLNNKAKKNDLNIKQIIVKFDEVKISYQNESYVNIIVLGDPGVGKSTLVKVINDRYNAGFLARFRSVTGVELHTAGIVPYVLNDKDMGKIIVHDLAGQVEYYSSHTELLRNVLQKSVAVFVIIVSLADERLKESLEFWLSIVENASTSKQCHIFVVLSHNDTFVANKTERLGCIQNTLKHKSSDKIYHTHIFGLDCRKLGGEQLNSFTSLLSNACKFVRENMSLHVNLYCYMLFDFLRSQDKAVYSLHELIDAIKQRRDCLLPTGRSQLFHIIQSLSFTGMIVYLVEKSNPAENVWIINNESVLIKDLNRILFALAAQHDEQFVSQTGIVKLSKLNSICLEYDPNMIVLFLEFMKLSFEIDDKKFILSSVASSENVINERYFFIPAVIVNSDKPGNTDQFQFGWCLQCSDTRSFFLSMFIHQIILSLLKYTNAKSPDNFIDCNPHIWSNGIYWRSTYGISVLAEMFNKHRSFVLLMSFKNGCYEQMSLLRKAVIQDILSCKHLVLPKTSLEESVIDNTDLQYPQILSKISNVPLFSIHEFTKCYYYGNDFIISRATDKKVAVDILLQGTDVKEQCESVLAGRISKSSTQWRNQGHLHAQPPLSTQQFLQSSDNSLMNIFDIFNVLRNKVMHWNAIGCELGVELNDRENLQKDINLNDSGRLERVINIWLKTNPTWDNFITALRNLQYNDIVHSITKKPLSPDEQLSKASIPKHLASSALESPTGTSVYSVLLKYKPRLLGIINDPDAIAVELRAKHLLSLDTQDHLSTTTGTSHSDKASLIIHDVLRYFKEHDNDRESFLKFCKVLRDHGQPGLNELAEEMEQTKSVDNVIVQHERVRAIPMSEHSQSDLPPHSTKEEMNHIAVKNEKSLAEYKARLEEAMAECQDKITQLNVMLHGPPGVGKTSLFQVIVGKDPLPKEERNSTDIMKNPIRAITTDQFNESDADDDTVQFKQISDDEMHQLIAEYIMDLPENISQQDSQSAKDQTSLPQNHQSSYDIESPNDDLELPDTNQQQISNSQQTIQANNNVFEVPLVNQEVPLANQQVHHNAGQQLLITNDQQHVPCIAYDQQQLPGTGSGDQHLPATDDGHQQAPATDNGNQQPPDDDHEQPTATDDDDKQPPATDNGNQQPSDYGDQQPCWDDWQPAAAQHFTYEEIGSKLSKVQPSSRMFNSKWHNLIDSGGQPQFQDMLPLLFRSPSFQIVLMRLTEGLDDKPKMCFTVEGENVVPPDDLNLTNLQYIERACQIAADANPVSKVMIVGTHKDKLKGDIGATLAILEEGLAELRKKYEHVIFPTKDGNSIFPINTMVEGEERKGYTKQMQDAIKSVTGAIAKPQPVPLRWFAFQLALRSKHASSVIKMKDCIKLGRRYDMKKEVVEDALKFFNQSALLLYYPDAAPDLILTKIDPIIKRLSKLVAATFYVKLPSELQPCSHLCTALKERGLFDGKAFPCEKLFETFSDGLTSQELFTFLKSLKLATLVDEEKQLYFLPSALSYLSPDECTAYKGGLSFGFILDRDEGQHILPHSFFFTTVVELLSNSEEYQFEIRSDKQYRNRIRVHDKNGKIPGAVILFDKTWWLKVTMTSTNPSRCPTIYKAVKRAIDCAITELKHTSIAYCREVFPCPIEGHSEHYCIITADKKDYTCSSDESLTGPVTEDMACWIEGINKANAHTKSNAVGLGVSYFVKKIDSCLQQPEYKGAQGIIIVVGMFGAAGTTIDVENIGKTFKKLGFAVLPVQDPTNENLANLIKAASQVEYPKLKVFRFFGFYFAGHGGADDQDDLFVCTAETDPTTKTYPIIHIEQHIVEPLKDLSVPYRFFFFDCCQTPGFGQAYHSNPTSHSQKVQKRTGQVVAHAVSRGQVAVGDIDEGGLWTRHLCKNLTENIPLITVLTRTSDAVDPQSPSCTISGIGDSVIIAKKGKDGQYLPQKIPEMTQASHHDKSSPTDKVPSTSSNKVWFLLLFLAVLVGIVAFGIHHAQQAG